MIQVTACEETIEFRGDYSEPKVVIYSLFEAGKDITISLARSYPIPDHPFKPVPITNADVKLYSDGGYITTLTHTMDLPPEHDSPSYPFSIYVASGVTPQPGKLYRLEVSVPGLPDAWTEVSLPSVVAIDDIDTFMEPLQSADSSDWGHLIKANVRFADPPDTENYYRVVVRYTSGRYDGPIYEPFNENNEVMVFTGVSPLPVREDPIVNPGGESPFFGQVPINRLSIFSDELISGKDYELKLTMGFSPRDTNYYEFEHYEVDLQSISKDLYLYLLTSSVQIESHDNPHAEPVIVYSNIRNGLGVVGAVSSSRSTIKYGQFPVDGVKYLYIDSLGNK
jgi:hypothetical protein